MKSIAVFGATGMTGLCVLKEALNQEYKIRVLLRDPSKLPNEFNGKVDVVKGDVLNLENVKETLKGQDAVIVTLGTRNDLSRTTVMSEGLKNILTAMKELNITVVSVCLSSFLFWEDSKVPPMFREINAEHKRMESILKASDLNWIAVYPPHISNDEPSGYTIKWGEPTNHKVVSKYDLARFFVDGLVESDHYKQAVGISSVTGEDSSSVSGSDKK